MTDPHIDIDEVANPNVSTNGSADIPVGNAEGSAGFNPNFSDLATGFFSFLERMRGQTGFGAGAAFEPLPYDSRKHFRTSQREFLLGWRSLIDDAIRRLDEREVRDTVKHDSEPLGNSSRPGSGFNKIEVEEIED